MSVWEFSAAVHGWIDAHTPDDASMSDAEQEAIWAKLQNWQPRGAAQ